MTQQTKETARKYAAPAVKVVAGLAMMSGVDFPETEQGQLVEAVVTVAGASAVLWGMIEALYRRFSARWS